MISTADSAARTHAQPVIDATLGERAFPDEPRLTAAIGEAIEDSLRRRYAPGDVLRDVLRDVHTKAHGCVRAEYRVAPKLPSALAHGVFVPGANYTAWIRISNGSKVLTRADIKGDARGMAIKLENISGTSLLPDDHQCGQGITQDFILISHPVFFANDPRRYLNFIAHHHFEPAANPLLVNRAVPAGLRPRASGRQILRSRML